MTATLSLPVAIILTIILLIFIAAVILSFLPNEDDDEPTALKFLAAAVVTTLVIVFMPPIAKSFGEARAPIPTLTVKYNEVLVKDIGMGMHKHTLYTDKGEFVMSQPEKLEIGSTYQIQYYKETMEVIELVKQPINKKNISTPNY